MIRTALAISLLAAAPVSATTFSQDQVENAIARYFHESHIDLPKKYFSKVIPAYGKSPPVMLMYLYGTSDWCGSSGCEVLVLEMGRDGPKVVSEVSAWPPITFDGRSSSGYPLIGVWHHGGGQLKADCEELVFQPNGSESPRQNKNELAAAHKRCASSKHILFNWPKKDDKDH